jgi:hypothetical protein
VIALVWVALAIALGCVLVYRFGRLGGFEPQWARFLILFGAGSAAGMGLGPCLFFLCRLAAPGIPRLSLFLEIAALAWLAFEIRVRSKEPAAPVSASISLFVPALIVALSVAFLTATVAISGAWKANPQGDWDAWSMWNLRARFLAAGDLPQRAWSPLLTSSHPDYPLLVSSFVARSWAYTGSFGESAPMATSGLFFLALLTTLVGGFAILRGRSIGLLAGLGLLGAPTLLHEVTVQYADIPMACYMAAAMMLALLERPLLAGLFAGLAAWTKDEGVLFLIVFLAVMAVARRQQFWTAAAGAIPGGAVAAFFKFALAPAAPLYTRQTGAQFVQKLTDFGRLGEVIASFAHEFVASGSGLYHPIFPVWCSPPDWATSANTGKTCYLRYRLWP